MPFYPILVNAGRKSVIVAGGGEQAAGKVASLVQAEVCVVLLTDTWHPCLDPFRHHPFVTIRKGPLTVHDFNPGSLVFLADEAREHAREMKAYAEQKGAWLNVVDEPEWCDFYSMGQIRRGDLIIAVATSGKAPALARDIRRRLEKEFDEQWAQRVAQAADSRASLRKPLMTH